MPRNANQSKSSNYSMDFDGSTSAIVISSDFGLTASNSSFTFSSFLAQEIDLIGKPADPIKLGI